MSGDVGLVAKVINTIFSWFTDEDGMIDFLNRRKGDSLEKAANQALRTWKLDPTRENWRAYKDAEAALVHWSNAS